MSAQIDIPRLQTAGCTYGSALYDSIHDHEKSLCSALLKTCKTVQQHSLLLFLCSIFIFVV